MAYDKRIAELESLLKAAAPDEQDASRRALAECIRRYADLRSRALDSLVSLIKDSTIGTTGIQDRWQSLANQARADVDRHFGDSAKDVLMPAPLQTFWFAAVQFEREFFEKLTAVKTPQFVEDLLTHQGVLARMIDDLQTNWNDLLSAEKSLEGDQLRTIQELDRLVQELTREIEAQHRAVVAETTIQLQQKAKESAEHMKAKVKEAVGERATEIGATVLEIARKFIKEQFSPIPGELDVQIEAQKNRAQMYIEKLATFSRAYRERAEEYRRLMSIEKGGVLTMFKNTRAQVAEYEKNNNLVTAQIMRDESKRALSDWAGNTVSAQKDDAAEFNGRIFDVIDRNWKVTEEIAKQFQSKFAGVFTAPLTSDTLETLTESYLFRQAIDSVNGRGTTAKIDEAQKALAASVSDTVEQAAQPLESMCLDWPAELKEAAQLSNAEFRKYVHDRLKSQIDTSLQYLGELRILLDPPKVVADFSREELEAMLRG